MKTKLIFIWLIVFISLCSQAYAAIIDDDWAREIQDGLRLMTIEFDNELLSKDGPFTIYSGPGKQYTTLAENIESPCIGYSAGAVGNWLLMDTPYGIGYVYFDDLQNTEKVKSLRFPYVAAIAAPDDCRIIRSPYGRWYGEIIQEGTPLIPLAEYENCLYVESSVDGAPIRGFIPAGFYSIEWDWKDELAEAGYYVGREVNLIELYRKQYAIYKRDSVASGYGHTVGVKSDGTCVARGINDQGQCNVQDWENIIAVSASDYHTVGLRADGTVVAVGNNDYGQCDVQNWGGIVAISAGAAHTVGLTSAGAVVVAGDNTMFQHTLTDWALEGIVEISAGGYFTIGLTSDGRVLNAGWQYSPAYEYFMDFDDSHNIHNITLHTSEWQNIVSVSAGHSHVVGLKADGTVVGDGETCNGEQDSLHEWSNVAMVAAAGGGTYCVTQDGYFLDGFKKWEDVQFIDASDTIVVGVRSDGTVISSPANYSYVLDSQYDLNDWQDIGLSQDSEVFVGFVSEDSIARLFF